MTAPCSFLAPVALALVLAAAAHSPAARAAAPLYLKCDIKMDVSGERYSHLVMLDPDHGVVTDGPMHFEHGGPSVPLKVDGLNAYVRRDGSRVEWGVISRRTDELVSGFSIDVNTGSYLLFDENGRPDAHGHCKTTTDSV